MCEHYRLNTLCVPLWTGWPTHYEWEIVVCACKRDNVSCVWVCVCVCTSLLLHKGEYRLIILTQAKKICQPHTSCLHCLVMINVHVWMNVLFPMTALTKSDPHYPFVLWQVTKTLPVLPVLKQIQPRLGLGSFWDWLLVHGFWDHSECKIQPCDWCLWGSKKKRPELCGAIKTSHLQSEC